MSKRGELERQSGAHGWPRFEPAELHPPRLSPIPTAS